MKIRLPLPVISVLLASVLLGACSPKYNWRDYASQDAPYRVMFPAKPASVKVKVCPLKKLKDAAA